MVAHEHDYVKYQVFCKYISYLIGSSLKSGVYCVGTWYDICTILHIQFYRI